MTKTRIARFRAASAFALFFLLALLSCIGPAADEETLDGIELWTDGIVHYKFDDSTFGPVAVHSRDQAIIEREMERWETAMTIDAGDGRSRQYINFEPCDEDCPESYLVIRYNRLYGDHQNCVPDEEHLVGTECECNNMPDPVGMELRGPDGNPDGITELHFRRGVCPREAEERGIDPPVVQDNERTNQSGWVIFHELGHVLGLWHEFNRGDADRWLVEDPDLDGKSFSEHFNTRAALMPVLGNYDHDSIMHYVFGDATDRHGNRFGNRYLDSDSSLVSERDKSRLLQYYARELHPNWGFFESLSITPTNQDELPNPYLSGDILVGGVWAVGTPAIAFQSSGNFDIFARGSDNRIYWKSFRENEPDDWVSLGCCFGSDPSAVSPRDGEIDLVVIGADTGKLIHKHFEDGEWGQARYVQDGYPTGGIKQSENGGYIGPAIASRGADSLDVFVVRSDGLLAITTLSNGEWTAWGTLGRGYDVTARPAAVALSETTVKLAFNERGMYLYEGGLTFAPVVPSFGFYRTAVMAYKTPPTLTKRDDPNDPYRVFITNADGRISHRFATGSWRDIGGIPKPGTGPSAVATGQSSALVVINGEDATGCSIGCAPGSTDSNQVIQAGGLWLRRFE